MEEIRIEEQRSEENTVNEQPEKKGSVGFLFDLVSIIATSAIAVAVVFLFVFTMYFSGGMIPTYVMVKNLGLVNTRWVLVLMGGLTLSRSRAR